VPAGYSIQFYDDIFISGGIPPVKYFWTPSEHLSDSAKIDAWANPKVSTDYYQYVIDSAGCKSMPDRIYSILTFDESNNIINEDLNKQTNLHQIGSEVFFNNPQGKVAAITCYTLDGRKIFSSRTKESIFDFGNLLKHNTIGMCVINIDGVNESLKIYNY
jgi:hypothetical protein